MSLINTARALDDIRFKWRVRAALLKVATIRKDSQLAEEIAYAEHILRNPMSEAPQLEALCATDIGVVEMVTVDQYNTVNTEAVKDDTIFYVADVSFSWLARKHAQGAVITSPSGGTTGVWATNGAIASTGE